MKGLISIRSLFGRGSFGRKPRSSRRAAQGGIEPVSSSAQRGLLGNQLAKAAITSGAFSLTGDLIAQIYGNKSRRMDLLESIDLKRAACMGSFGFMFYGPYQHWWYGLLGSRWPSKSTSDFLIKVSLNQLALAPVVLSAVFTWNLILQQKSSEVRGKLKRDLLPTMVNGWKFWIPAASINFYAVPVQSQVLYMSVCSVLWTAYLSFSSYSNAKATQPKSL